MPEPVTPRVVATDLDGTLLRSDGTLSARTRDAIVACEDAGIGVVFVTARPPRWLDDLADVVGDHGIALCGNGAFVYDVASRAVIGCQSLDPGVIDDVHADLRAAIPQIAFGAERADGGWFEEGFAHPRKDVFVTGCFAELVGAPVGKLLARCEALSSQEFLDRVTAVVADRMEIAYSGAYGLAEMTACGVTKATALARWCRQRGVAAGEVWAFGDMPNDIPMLTWAGTAYAVANAHAEVQAIVDATAASNDDDGVARVLESLV